MLMESHMTIHADLMRKKRERLRAQGLRDVTTPLPETIIAEIDDVQEQRGFRTRGHAIAEVWQEWKQMKAEREAATN